MRKEQSVIMLGASGAVGSQAVQTLLTMSECQRVSLLLRRKLPLNETESLQQFIVDVTDAQSYAHLISAHDSAICTLGVGQPSKISDAEFVRIDRDVVLAFAIACKRAGVRHFVLLSAVGANADSRSLYLRTKGELQNALQALQFEQLSIFQPSMILTPVNRYGLAQALLLLLWPKINWLLSGSLRKYRGIKVAQLGAAMAYALRSDTPGLRILQWPDFVTQAPEV